jgi:hypothetical protein
MPAGIGAWVLVGQLVAEPGVAGFRVFLDAAPEAAPVVAMTL